MFNEPDSAVSDFVNVNGQNLEMFIISLGARYLMQEKLKVIWAEFSTLSYAVLLQNKEHAWHTHCHF
jgi:hypothetical protein